MPSRGGGVHPIAYEERACVIESRQTSEVDIGGTDDVEGADLGDAVIENVDIASLSVADIQDNRYIPAQIAPGVALHRRLGRAKWCPRKERQAQIDSLRVEGIDGIVAPIAARFARLLRPSSSDGRPGKTVVGKARARRGTLSACKR